MSGGLVRIQDSQGNSAPLVGGGSVEIEKMLPDTRALATAVAAFPQVNFDQGPNQLRVYKDPRTEIGPAHASFHLEVEDTKVIIVVGCPASGPELARIVLWKGGEWNVVLQTGLNKFEPHNHGMTQAHIDAITAYVENLRTAPQKFVTSDIAQIGCQTHKAIGHVTGEEEPV